MSYKAKTSAKLPIPTLEQFGSFTLTTTDVDTTAEKVPATALNYRRGILIQNNHGTNTVYIGPSTVTADTTSTGGYQLGPSDSVFMTLDGGTDVYAISSAADSPVCTIEFA